MTTVSLSFAESFDCACAVAATIPNLVAKGVPALQEFDWYAIDACGHIAMLTSFHLNGVPARLLSNRTEFLDVHMAVHQLPKQGAAVPIASCRTDSWMDYSKVGLFGFSSHDEPTTHEKMSAPSAPILTDALPSVIQNALRKLQFVNLCFARTPSVNTKHLGELIFGPV
jgi:hypothetical protein